MKRLFAVLVMLSVSACAGRMNRRFTPSFLTGENQYLVSGDTDEAEAALKEALLEKPAVHTHFLLADLYDNTGRPAQALDHYLAALRLTHENGDDAASAVASAMGVVAVRDRVEGFFERFLSFMATLEKKRQLPDEAWYQLLNLKYGLLRNRGRFEEADAARASLGCLYSWQMAGPFGPWVWRGFDTKKKEMETAPWPATVDLGPGRGRMTVREETAETCFVTLDNPDIPIGGVSYGRTVLTRKRPGKVHLRLQTGDAISIRIGRKEVMRRDTRTAFLGKVAWQTVAVPAGQVEIIVKTAGDSTFPSFSLVLWDDDGSAAFSHHTPRPRTPPTQNMTIDVLDEAAPVFSSGQSVEHYAALKIALWFDDMAEARKHAAVLTPEGSDRAPVVSLNMAELIAADPALPGNLAYEQARPFLVEALEREPRFWQARVGLAYRELDEDRMLKAVALLEEGLSLCPAEVTIPRKLADTFLGYDWEVEAADMVKRLQDMMPTSCNTYAWQLALARKRLRYGDARALAGKLSTCDAFSGGLLTEYKRAETYKEVIAEATRLAKQSPKNSAARLDVADAKAAVGDLAGAMAATTEALALSPLDPDIRISLADGMNVQGKHRDAALVLEKGLSEPLASKPALLEAQAALNNDRLLASERIDGLEVIEEYQKAGNVYDNAAVYVLDRAVYNVDSDGAIVMLVHSITHLQTDEAVEAHGELEIPSGARLLTARTIKADGRILVPEAVDGKETLSMPDLQPGDFVESEYVLFNYPNQLFPGGFDTGRFYFQDFDTAFHRTEIIVSVPESLRVAYDERGACPAVKETRQDGRRRLTWRTRNAHPYPEEPLSPIASEFLPSVRVVSGASFENLFGRVSDQIADKNRDSHVIEAAVKAALEEIGDTAEADAKRRALYRWVMDNISPEQDTFGEASHMVAARAGNRARVFAAMLHAAGLPARLVLVKSVGEDQTPNAVAAISLYTHLLVDVGDKEIIDLSSEHTPYGFLSPGLRRRPMRYLDSGEAAKTGGGRVPFDTQHIVLNLKIDNEGTATGKVAETLTGALAAQWRSGLEKNHDLEQKRVFQGAYLAAAIPGAVLKDLKIIGQADAEAPLVFEYTIESRGFATAEGDVWRVELPFPTNLGKQAGGLPKRMTDLVMGLHIAKSVTSSLELPKGSRVVSKKTRDVSHDSQWGNIRQTQSVSERKAEISYQTQVDISRIPPKTYQSFLDFASNVDKTSRIVLRYETGKHE